MTGDVVNHLHVTTGQQHPQAGDRESVPGDHDVSRVRVTFTDAEPHMGDVAAGTGTAAGMGVLAVRRFGLVALEVVAACVDAVGVLSVEPVEDTVTWGHDVTSARSGR